MKTKLQLEFFTYLWTVGQASRFTNKEYYKLLYGKRYTSEVFKTELIRSMFFRIVPLIHNIFFNFSKNYNLKKNTRAYYEMNFSLYKTRSLPIKILFATTTVAYGDILSNAAIRCNMPFNRDRWLNGSLSGNIKKLNDFQGWHFFNGKLASNVQKRFRTSFVKTRLVHQEFLIRDKLTQKPDLIVIPDIRNNAMICHEAKNVKIPIIGLINSDCPFTIDYPVPGNDSSFDCVYLFCELLSFLIKKELVFFQHNRAIVSKNIITFDDRDFGPKDSVSLSEQDVSYRNFRFIRRKPKPITGVHKIVKTLKNNKKYD